MIWTKTYRTPTDTLLAAADEELLGREFREGKFKLKVSESFYKDVLVDEKVFGDLLALCSVANLVGSRCIAVATDLGLVTKDNVLYIEGVPHAQFSIME
ncbi:MAG: DUF424 domain-containing protein [Thermoplasmata archaeon]